MPNKEFPVAQSPFWTVQGMYRIGKKRMWSDIYHYREMGRCRSVYRHIIDMDELTEELDIYDDFRIAKPGPSADERRRAARRSRQEGSAKEMTARLARTPRKPAKRTTASDKPRKKRRRRVVVRR